MPLGILVLMTIRSSHEKKIDIRQKNSIVVVADDDRDNLLVVSFVLNALKLRHYLADNGKAALDLVYDKKPNLVLLDIVMPYLDGMEANILIKNDLFTNHISTIAITGLTEPEHITAIENAGFDDYIVKPFIIENLETKVKYFISQ